jgi:hypothetical protein
MGYELFKTKMRSKDRNVPIITIYTGRAMSINRVCYRTFFKEKKYALLYYDQELKKIGIKPTEKHEYWSRKLIDCENDRRTIILSIKAFLNHYHIDLKETTSYIAQWNDKEKMVEINLQTNEE